MNFHLVVTEQAERDLMRIGDWIGSRSPEGAARWLESAWSAIRSLEKNAIACSLAPENEMVPQEVRNIMFRTRRGLYYRAIFIVDGSRVIITHIRGPGQSDVKPEELKDE